MPVQRNVDEGKWLLAENQTDIFGYVFDPKLKFQTYSQGRSFRELLFAIRSIEWMVATGAIPSSCVKLHPPKKYH